MGEVDQGLREEEARRRLSVDGPNALRVSRGPGTPQLLVRQFREPMVGLLAAAALLSGWVGEPSQAVAIAAIVLLNVAVGFWQELHAERALEALRAVRAPSARVVREGRIRTVDARTLVAGDLLCVEAGDVVAADAQLLRAHRLRTNEALLTGESFPVDKRADERVGASSLLFAGTQVVAGSGRGLVTATGARTRLGAVAALLDQASPGPTPLQRAMRRLVRQLSSACVVLVGVEALVLVRQGRPWSEVALGALALAVAAVPEGLGAVVTVALALGVRRLARVNVLVRRLSAVETMGAVTVVCTDKTGTLTTGRVRVQGHRADDPQALFRAAAACCEATLGEGDDDSTGDPLEVAVLVEARVRGIERDDLDRRAPVVDVVPFDPETRRMEVVRADGLRYVKGALEALAPDCGGPVEGYESVALAMAAAGQRVLAVATGPAAGGPLSMVGLVAFADTVRPEAAQAIADARMAGVRTVMVTGDHLLTARGVGHELGMAPDAVVARATPADKLALVRRLKAAGEVVAMTGDGVNDAPALKEAHVGVAMGKGGTEVAREAAAVVLADDHFASLVAGLREGRAVHDNLVRTVCYVVTGNASELTLVLAAGLLGLAPPLAPLHLLWLNVVTETLPAMLLVDAPAAADVLTRRPRPPAAPLVSAAGWRRVAAGALLEGGVAFAAYLAARPEGEAMARCAAFFVLVDSALLRSLGALRAGRSGGRASGAVVALVGLQNLLLQWAPARALFDLPAVTPARRLAWLTVACVPALALSLGSMPRGSSTARATA
jgi:Ca2+-transporting ATPase